MKCLGPFLIATLLMFGCASDDVCDPSGLYSLSYSRTSGNCDELANDTIRIVKLGPDTFQLLDEAGNIYTGTVMLSPTCGIDASTAFVDQDIAVTGRYALSIDGETIDGTLTITAKDNSGVPPDLSCDGTYKVTGALQ